MAASCTMLREWSHADVITVAIAPVVTLSVQAGLAFQKYHFHNCLMLGTILVMVDWYEETACRKDLPQSRSH